MGELIRVGAEEGSPGLGATINTTGAWVTSLSDGKDHIFFPVDSFPTEEGGIRIRGGMHACSPHFGKDPYGVGQQHGYARLSEWKVIGRNSRYVSLEHKNEAGIYGGLYQQLGLQIVNIGNIHMLTVNLSFVNTSTDNLIITPGFHPYFSGPTENDECGPEAKDYIASKDDANPKRVDRYLFKKIELASGRTVQMIVRNLPKLIAWSDNPSEYHCFEPSLSGLNSDDRRLKVLSPGEKQLYVMNLKVEDSKELGSEAA